MSSWLLGLCCRRKMVRAPCCEKMGLKKGPWTPEEDQILVSYIQKYGHGNWRALPRQASLLRCGKSCRLRWINYLRPDIKRGNFTGEEEETIIKLHELLGNRWSAIAARLPGRTDNEIKNVWHTDLKKRLQQNPTTSVNRRRPKEVPNYSACLDSKPAYFPNQQRLDNPIFGPVSPQHSSSELSSTTTDSSASSSEDNNFSIKDEYTAEFNEKYWSDAFPVEDSNNYKDFQATINNPPLEFPLSTGSTIMNAPCNDESMDFWFNLLMETGSLSELPEIDVS